MGVMHTSLSKRKLDFLKIRLIDGILIFGTIFGSILIVKSLFPIDEHTFNFDFYTDLLAISILIILFLRRNVFSLVSKSIAIIFVLYVFVVTDILQYGLYSSDKILIMIIPFLSILVFSPSATLSLFLFMLFNYLLIGYLISHKILIPTILHSPLDLDFERWIESAGIISIVSFAITLFVHKFNETMFRFFVDLEVKNEQLSERENLLSRITNGIPRPYIILVDKDLKIIFAGGQAFRTRDTDPEAILRQNLRIILGDETQEIKDQVCEQYQNTFVNGPQVGEYFIADEYMLVKTIPLINSEGETTSVLGFTENITEQVLKDRVIQNNLEEKNVMLQEIHHRVKNNLAVVSGLLDLQSLHLSDGETQEILKKSTNRILSIAKVHEMLYESKDFNRLPFDDYIIELTKIILASMNMENRKVEIETNISVKNVNINLGVPLGIIFNELITNSVKYAFNIPRENSESNRISIHVKPVNGQIEVEYQDNGPGIPDFEKASNESLGFTLIAALMEQIQGNYNYDTFGKFMLSFSFPSDQTTGPYHMQ